jgi:hypothetical protein
MINQSDLRLKGLQSRCDELQAALEELVALRDMKDRVLGYANTARKHPTVQQVHDEAARLHAEYVRRSPLAWRGARAVLKRHLRETPLSHNVRATMIKGPEIA